MKAIRTLCFSICVILLGFASFVAGTVIERNYVFQHDVSADANSSNLVSKELEQNCVSSGLLGRVLMELNGDGLPVPEDIASKISDATVINEDVVGWISIPELSVDYPVLYSDSNYKYIRTGLDGSYNVRGCIYLDARCSNPLLTIKLIHGHNMADGTMFSHLPEMFELTDLSEAPVISYTDSLGYKEFAPISVFSIDATQEGIFLDDWASLNDLTQLKLQFVERSLVPVSEVPQGVELLLLNTCWYGESGLEHNLHCIVVAVRIV